jgi:hypothetical protein
MTTLIQIDQKQYEALQMATAREAARIAIAEVKKLTASKWINEEDTMKMLGDCKTAYLNDLIEKKLIKVSRLSQRKRMFYLPSIEKHLEDNLIK